MNTPVRIVIVDDHVIVRRGIRALLATEPGMEVVAEAGTGEEAIYETDRHRPDVVLMDLEMPNVHGVEAIERIVADHPGVRVLVLTSFATDDKVWPAIKAGASGYLLKNSGPRHLTEAIQQVHRGEAPLHPDVARMLLEKLQGPQNEDDITSSPTPLTEREKEVLDKIARGCSNVDIAEQLCIEEATTRTHVSNILTKLGVENRTQAALYAFRMGITPIDEVLRS